MIMTHDFPFEAIWHNSSSDTPVKIIGLMGQHNGKRYFQAEGTTTGIPEDQLEDFIYYFYSSDNGNFVLGEKFEFIPEKSKEFYRQSYPNPKLVEKHTLKERITYALHVL